MARNWCLDKSIAQAEQTIGTELGAHTHSETRPSLVMAFCFCSPGKTWNSDLSNGEQKPHSRIVPGGASGRSVTNLAKK